MTQIPLEAKPIDRETIRICVSGSRTWTNSAAIRHALEQFTETTELSYLLIHGGATGADTIAADLAKEWGWEIQAYPVSADDWKRIGKSAGPRRNRRMINEGKPDIVFAFPDPDHSPGTLNLVAYARGKGIPVIVYGEIEDD